MKQFFTIIALVFAVQFAYTQEKTTLKEKSESKLELFSSETGTLIEKSNVEIGKVGTIQIQTSVITNLLSGTKVKGLRIEKPSLKTYGRDAINFLDEDEIDGVIKSIEILREKVQTTPSSYVEIIFQARSGFEFGAFYSKEWKYFIKVDKYDSDSMYFMKEENLNIFDGLTIEGKQKLAEL